MKANMLRFTRMVLASGFLICMLAASGVSQRWHTTSKTPLIKEAIDTERINGDLSTGGLDTSKYSVHFKDPTAKVTLANVDSIDTDESSLVSWGPKFDLVVEPYSVIHLRQQSGLRLLKSALLYVGQRVNISASESGHITVSGNLSVYQFSEFSIVYSRF